MSSERPARAELEERLAHAPIPTLVMCLAQITGNERWLLPPYAPKRDVRLFADESGGLSPDAQREVRDAMATTLRELESGQRVVPPPPDLETFTRLMRVCVAEDVPSEYSPMAMESFNFESSDANWSAGRPGQADNFSVLIVGAGVSGVCAAIKLERLGIPWTLVEKNSDVGGTWFENEYPESGVDTPNHFYSYSFAPNYRWSNYFSKRDEVLTYIRDTAKRFGVLDKITFNREVTSLVWDDSSSRWVAQTSSKDGESQTLRVNAVISAVGQLNRPKIPNIPGLASFAGTSFHTARWPRDLNLAGKRVAIVGTGASAMQLLRTVADVADSVTIFQRSPQWVRPTAEYHRKVEPETQWLLQNIPFYYHWYRFGLFWRYADGLLRLLHRDPAWAHPARSVNRSNDRHRFQMTEYLTHELEGREDLIEKVLPDYPPYGKRILVDNDWYKTLKRPNVSLVASSLEQVEGSFAIDGNGDRREFDVIVLATGFYPERLLTPIHIEGVGGTSIRDVWGDDDPRAYLGLTVPGFPNFFCLYGPNTNLGHGGSIIFQAECQVKYITESLIRVIEGGISSLEVRQDVHDRYNRAMDAEHEKLVWTHPGMRTWYRNDRGRVFSIMPWRHVDYWQMTRRPNLDEYIVRSAAEEIAQVTDTK